MTKRTLLEWTKDNDLMLKAAQMADEMVNAEVLAAHHSVVRADLVIGDSVHRRLDLMDSDTAQRLMAYALAPEMMRAIVQRLEAWCASARATS